MDIKIDNKTIVVFDLDDTLYNELDYLRSAYKNIAINLDPINWISLYSKMFSLYRSRLNAFEYLVQNYGSDLQYLLELYHNHKPNIVLFENVIETFKSIKVKGGSIGIITDGRSYTQRAKIESLKIYDFIDKLIISEEIGSEKPNKSNYIAIEKDFKGYKYYYVGDNFKKDFISPNMLSWNTIGLIDNGKNIHCESYNYMKKEYLPQHLISSFNDINIV